MKAIAARDWRVPSLPITVGQKPPSRVADLVVSQHTGIGQRRLRPTGTAAIAQFIYQ